MQWLIYIGCLALGFFMGIITTYGAHRERKLSTKKINMWVSMHKNLEYNYPSILLADRYRLEDGDPYLRVHVNGRKEWHQILEFQNSYLLLFTIDPEFAKEHISDYVILNATGK